MSESNHTRATNLLGELCEWFTAEARVRVIAKRLDEAEERAATRIANYLREMPCADPNHDERWCPTCEQRVAIADAILRGEGR